MQAPILDEEQFATVLQFARNMQRAPMYSLMILLSKKLGLRPMEIAGLETSWFVGQSLRIPLGHSKRKQGRTLPVDQEILTALDKHMQGREGRIFRNAAGDAFTANGISEAIRRIYRLSGVQGSCYSGRRTMATNLVDNKVNILVVQKLLGHSSPVTTMNYVGVSERMMREALFG
ncbi:tyrosine-type recombinase/integrase [Sphingobium sp. KCTC 72723]|uniref:tyrosine-type recombinase/integrase n=1 Tax=Sphingobium sp. KCTC 72723 TaxID=2733867 RepID=UPI00165DB8E8|nr:tyrosine-type recombinase/integrase [Sphingobium sp. KCTC 72723]